MLTYAEIPFDKVYDDEEMRLKDDLVKYDWLHSCIMKILRGSMVKFLAQQFRLCASGIRKIRKMPEAMAAKHGFKKVSQLKLAVAKKIRDFVAGGGYLFAMCSATDSYDIALAADGAQ